MRSTCRILAQPHLGLVFISQTISCPERSSTVLLHSTFTVLPGSCYQQIYLWVVHSGFTAEQGKSKINNPVLFFFFPLVHWCFCAQYCLGHTVQLLLTSSESSAVAAWCEVQGLQRGNMKCEMSPSRDELNLCCAQNLGTA